MSNFSEPLVHESLRKPLHYDLRMALSNAGIDLTGLPFIQLSAYNMTYDPPFEDKAGYWYLGPMTLEIGYPNAEMDLILSNNFGQLTAFLRAWLLRKMSLAMVPSSEFLTNHIATGYHALTRAMDEQSR